jgi:hypothetical protein
MKTAIFILIPLLMLAVAISLATTSSDNDEGSPDGESPLNMSMAEAMAAADESQMKADEARQRVEYAAGIADQPFGGDAGNIPLIDKFTEHDYLDQAVYKMMVDAGMFELDDPGDGWYRGISTTMDLMNVTIDNGRYNLGYYFDPGYYTLYHTYDIQVLGSVYIADGSP